MNWKGSGKEAVRTRKGRGNEAVRGLVRGPERQHIEWLFKGKDHLWKDTLNATVSPTPLQCQTPTTLRLSASLPQNGQV